MLNLCGTPLQMSGSQSIQLLRQSIDSIGSMWFLIHNASGKCPSMTRNFVSLSLITLCLISLFALPLAWTNDKYYSSGT